MPLIMLLRPELCGTNNLEILENSLKIRDFNVTHFLLQMESNDRAPKSFELIKLISKYTLSDPSSFSENVIHCQIFTF